MSQRDSLGLGISGASAAGIQHYEQALGMFQRLSGDPDGRLIAVNWITAPYKL